MVNVSGFGSIPIIFFTYIFLWSRWTIAERMLQQPEAENAEVFSLSAPREDGSRLLHLQASGQENLLHLEAANVFSPNLQQFAIGFSPESSDSVSAIAASQIGQVANNVNFYSVHGQRGSLYVNEDDLGVYVEGMLNDTHKIEPLLQKTPEGRHTRRHVVSKESFFPENDLKMDFSKLNALEDNEEPMDDNVRNYVVQNAVKSGTVPSTVTVEVLVLLDHVNAKNLGFDHGKIRKYVGVFWNKVNTVFQRTNNPKIKLNVTAIVYFPAHDTQPFLKNHQVDEKHALESFYRALSDFFEKTVVGLVRPFHVRYDVAMMQLAPKIGRLQNGKWKETVLGGSYTRSACSKDPRFNVAYAHDQASTYNGVIYAAHGIAHTLGASHDEDTKCFSQRGYIMNHDAGNNQKFTVCSLNAMKQFVRSYQGECTWD